MRKLIAVCGSEADDPNLSPSAIKIAEDIGYLIARRGAILICGGGGGIMEAACRGAKKGNGTTVGILPENKNYANPYVDIGIATHLGRARNYILVRSSDAVIGIAGRWGTLNEIALALNIGKPTLIVKGTGGWVDILSRDDVYDNLNIFPSRPFIVSSAKEAVDTIFKLIK